MKSDDLVIVGECVCFLEKDRLCKMMWAKKTTNT